MHNSTSQTLNLTSIAITVGLIAALATHKVATESRRKAFDPKSLFTLLSNEEFASHLDSFLKDPSQIQAIEQLLLDNPESTKIALQNLRILCLKTDSLGQDVIRQMQENIEDILPEGAERPWRDSIDVKPSSPER